MNNKEKIEIIKERLEEFNLTIKKIKVYCSSNSLEVNKLIKFSNFNFELENGYNKETLFFKTITIYLKDNIVVVLEQGDESGGFFQSDLKNKITLYSWSGIIYTSKVINISYDQRIIFHELIHLYNDRISNSKIPQKEYDSEGNFNHPEEINAYLYSELEKFFTKEEIEEWKNKYKSIDVINKILNKLISNDYNMSGFYNYLTNENKKKVKKKIYQYIYEGKINIIKDINKVCEQIFFKDILLEAFQFQSRGLKGREEEQDKINELKAEKFLEKLGGFNKLENMLRGLISKYYKVIGYRNNFEEFKNKKHLFFCFNLTKYSLKIFIYIRIDGHLEIYLRGTEEDYSSFEKLDEMSFDSIKEAVEKFLNLERVKIPIKNFFNGIEDDDIRNLKEDFSFQSRGLKSREEEKRKIEELKFKKTFATVLQIFKANDLKEFKEKLFSLYKQNGIVNYERLVIDLNLGTPVISSYFTYKDKQFTLFIWSDDTYGLSDTNKCLISFTKHKSFASFFKDMIEVINKNN